MLGKAGDSMAQAKWSVTKLETLALNQRPVQRPETNAHMTSDRGWRGSHNTRDTGHIHSNIVVDLWGVSQITFFNPLSELLVERVLFLNSFTVIPECPIGKDVLFLLRSTLIWSSGHPCPSCYRPSQPNNTGFNSSAGRRSSSMVWVHPGVGCQGSPLMVIHLRDANLYPHRKQCFLKKMQARAKAYYSGVLVHKLNSLQNTWEVFVFLWRGWLWSCSSPDARFMNGSKTLTNDSVCKPNCL